MDAQWIESTKEERGMVLESEYFANRFLTRERAEKGRTRKESETGSRFYIRAHNMFGGKYWTLCEFTPTAKDNLPVYSGDIVYNADGVQFMISQIYCKESDETNGEDVVFVLRNIVTNDVIEVMGSTEDRKGEFYCNYSHSSDCKVDVNDVVKNHYDDEEEACVSRDGMERDSGQMFYIKNHQLSGEYSIQSMNVLTRDGKPIVPGDVLYDEMNTAWQVTGYDYTFYDGRTKTMSKSATNTGHERVHFHLVNEHGDTDGFELVCEKKIVIDRFKHDIWTFKEAKKYNRLHVFKQAIKTFKTCFEEMLWYLVPILLVVAFLAAIVGVFVGLFKLIFVMLGFAVPQTSVATQKNVTVVVDTLEQKDGVYYAYLTDVDSKTTEIAVLAETLYNKTQVGDTIEVRMIQEETETRFYIGAYEIQIEP